MKNFSKISFAVIASMLASIHTRASSAGSDMSVCSFESGANVPRYVRKSPYVRLRSLQDGKTAANFFMRIRGDGVGILRSAENIPQLGELDLVKLKEMFGEPGSSIILDDKTTNESVFNLISVGDSEPEIFHIDMQSLKDGKLTSYRVRGHGISTPLWLQVK